MTSLFRFPPFIGSEENFSLFSFLPSSSSASKRVIFMLLFMFIIDNIIFLQPPHKIVIFFYSFAFNLFAPLPYNRTWKHLLSSLIIRFRITQLSPFCDVPIVMPAYDDESRRAGRMEKESFCSPLAIKNSMRVAVKGFLFYYS